MKQGLSKAKAGAYRGSPLFMLVTAEFRTVWFPSISTTHFALRSFSSENIDEKKKEKKKVRKMPLDGCTRPPHTCKNVSCRSPPAHALAWRLDFSVALAGKWFVSCVQDEIFCCCLHMVSATTAVMRNGLLQIQWCKKVFLGTSCMCDGPVMRHESVLTVCRTCAVPSGSERDVSERSTEYKRTRIFLFCLISNKQWHCFNLWVCLWCSPTFCNTNTHRNAMTIFGI